MTNNRVTWLNAEDPAERFPAVGSALSEPDGLLAAGGDLSTERLLYAYRHGIFPWYDAGQPLLWWSPDPRCVFLPNDYRVPRRLERELRKSAFELRVNSAFGKVIRACAAPRRSEQGTWITPDMLLAYERLHRQGWAHSIEVWQADELCGGLYGVAIGRAFFGESMFSLQSNASKIALLYLARKLNDGEFAVLDCQLTSSHLLSLGARTIRRVEFSKLLQHACEPANRYANWPRGTLACRELLQE